MTNPSNQPVLPTAYIEQIRQQLGPEAEPFLQSYQLQQTRGLRVNLQKLPMDHLMIDKLKKLFHLEPVAWCPSGFYYQEDARPGKHPYHAAGLYYIQEPSAMSSAELLKPKPGNLVLDLAAAPGGKSTQLAAMMQGRGLLISNEIHPARARILSENIERMGISNAVVVSAHPDQLAERFPSTFDQIMLDAPCSGEGMFRKDPAAIKEWSPQHVEMCAARQDDILAAAGRMLKPGGTLAYSTCTFNNLENEGAMERFLKTHAEFQLLEMHRFWPHQIQGEGHFAALLRRNDDDTLSQKKNQTHTKPSQRLGKAEQQAMAAFEVFKKESIPLFNLPDGGPLLFGDQLYWFPKHVQLPESEHWMKGLKTLRPGLHLGTLKKSRFEPSHALALALTNTQASHGCSFEADSVEIIRYLKGETLEQQGYKGWTPILVDGFPIGWAKADGTMLKNHYPKGLRWLG